MNDQIISVKDPHGYRIYFREHDHKYYDDDNNNYNSVTKIIHSLFPEFERDKMGYFVARKRLMKKLGVTDKNAVPPKDVFKERELVFEEWETTKNDACDMGTQVHRYCECKLRGIDFDMELTIDKGKKLVKMADVFLINLLKQYEFIEAEKIIFRRPWHLAGTVDLIMRNKNTNKLCIFDHKTNKEIKMSDSYGGRGKLFLNHIDNCNYYHYTLQLSLYKHMLLDGNYGDFEDCELGIFHYKIRKVRCYQLNDLAQEVKQIAEYAKKIKGTI